ncbi:c-di-GMP-binding flagellar brake protein YcgR, contains PilZNR and PilZ domains [Ectothiorhodospira magna]|uniref:C-di-GMP-binding flagellar brake protein YcgR, contains PilZNR and PilZ domains n=1 Tax=Ectothiorhodospira magna TaxID=867345 RepID=A0A1H9FYL1_9GAMM|nr:flagellar brake protein [Ectothiorhodospira magna]SEQ43015.1 c-di-GMP-binding flagellar brake protein YcgR, contains PilZNR and PilZ domains [Ectothiorhodospira magna]
MTSNNSSLVRSRKRQGSIFHAIKQSRSLFMVQLPRLGLQGLTQIIDTDLDEEELWLDIPNDQDLLNQLIEGTRLVVRGTLQGVPIRFETRFIRREPHGGEDALVCQWPDELDYQQRRNAFRVSIPRSMAAHVRWVREREDGASEPEQEQNQEPDLVHESRLADLSIQGLGMESEICSQDCPQVGDRVCITQLSVSGQQWSDIQAEVRSIKPMEGDESLVRLGMKFLELSPGADRSLNRLLMEMQYEAARRR